MYSTPVLVYLSQSIDVPGEILQGSLPGNVSAVAESKVQYLSLKRSEMTVGGKMNLSTDFFCTVNVLRYCPPLK